MELPVTADDDSATGNAVGTDEAEDEAGEDERLDADDDGTADDTGEDTAEDTADETEDDTADDIELGVAVDAGSGVVVVACGRLGQARAAGTASRKRKALVVFILNERMKETGIYLKERLELNGITRGEVYMTTW